jgi:hypothetical protein
MLLLGLITGFFLGVRHCFEPDHLTAVAHFASAARSPRDGLRAGLLWGLGHGAAVLAIGLTLSSLGSPLAAPTPWTERAVGGTLVALSVWRLRSLFRKPHVHAHRHDGGVVHVHPHAHGGAHLHAHAPTLTGVVHGTAGAAGIALVLSLVRTPVSVALLALSFGAGTLVAMGAAAWLAARLYSKAAIAGWERPAVILTAACGFGLGLFWIASA